MKAKIFEQNKCVRNTVKMIKEKIVFMVINNIKDFSRSGKQKNGNYIIDKPSKSTFKFTFNK